MYRSSCTIEHGTKTLGNNIRRRIRVPLDASHCDVVALVAIDKRRVAFLPVSDVSQGGSVSVPVAQFNHPDAERLSWLRSVENF
jgi:hypothetical protein